MAFLGTVPARLGAVPTMVLAMFSAFLGAGIANLRRYAADLIDEPRASTHEDDAQAAHFRAINTEAGAIRHAAQTGVGAVITLLSAAATGGDT
jgi:hypothetical protein